MVQWNLTPKRVLRTLFWLRVVSMVLQGGVIALAATWFAGQFKVLPLIIALGVLSLFNILVYLRLERSWLVTEAEVAGHLLFDVIQYTVVLYFTGGATNPFVSIYLLPVALGAAALRLPFAVLVGACCAVAYSLLLIDHEPMAMMDHHISSNFNLHVWGMWLNFLLAAVLLILFVGMLAGLLRGHEREMAAARERTLRDEAILAVGTLAAGAAHQLGTPLSTMNVLVEDWLDQGADKIDPDDIRVMADQVRSCRQTLHQMLDQVRESRGEAGHHLSVRQFFNDCLERWQVTRPDILLETDIDEAAAAVSVRYDVTFAQALTNLLNNAADASVANGQRDVAVRVEVLEDQLHCRVHDRGSGLDGDPAATAQGMFRSSKVDGMGIGLALSNSTIERLQGTVSFHQDERGGVTWIQVPLLALAATGERHEDSHH